MRARGEIAALCVLLVLLLVQVGWTFRIELMSSPLGTALRTTCERLACPLPTLSAPEALVASDIMVRSHPQIRGALVAGLTIDNDGNFHQPLPDVMLTLTDGTGAVIARKNFAPATYRYGELATLERIDAGQRIRIELSFTDPGEQAIVYSFHFFPALPPDN